MSVKVEMLANKLMAQWARGDIKELNSIFSPDAVYVANGTQYNGHDEIAGYVLHVQSWATELIVEIVRLYFWENGAAVEWIMSGVQIKPIPGRVAVATGRNFRLQGTTIVGVTNNLIARAVDYYDVLSFVLQLGSSVNLPGGVQLNLDNPTDQ